MKKMIAIKIEELNQNGFIEIVNLRVIDVKNIDDENKIIESFIEELHTKESLYIISDTTNTAVCINDLQSKTFRVTKVFE